MESRVPSGTEGLSLSSTTPLTEGSGSEWNAGSYQIDLLFVIQLIFIFFDVLNIFGIRTSFLISIPRPSSSPCPSIPFDSSPQFPSCFIILFPHTFPDFIFLPIPPTSHPHVLYLSSSLFFSVSLSHHLLFVDHPTISILLISSLFYLYCCIPLILIYLLPCFLLAFILHCSYLIFCALIFSHPSLPSHTPSPHLTSLLLSSPVLLSSPLLSSSPLLPPVV